MIFDLAPSTLLRASQLTYRRGNASLFKALSFDVNSNQILWLQGQNGRGKTSLLRILAGLVQPEHGTLMWKSPTHPEKFSNNSSRMVYIGHANGLKDELTACEALQFLAQLHGHATTPNAALTALRKLHIDHCCNQPIRTLSQGQQRRVALARLTLECAPSLWILDEPFDTLDSDGVRTVNDLLVEHLARQGSVVLTSHIPLEPMGVEVCQLNLDEVRR